MANKMKDLVGAAAEKVPAMSAKEAHAAAANGDVILDVREPAELEMDGRIDGALHIPRGVLESRAFAEMPTKDDDLCATRGDRRIHVLCASGARATLAADTLRRMGYNSTVIEGGLKAWKSAGLKVS